MIVAQHYLACTMLGVAAIFTAACGDSTRPIAPATGAIEITTLTAGAKSDLDSSGYTLSIDSGPSSVITDNAKVTISNLTPGNHVVFLFGLASNCWLSGNNRRVVNVVGSALVPVSFAVFCEANGGPSPWDY